MTARARITKLAVVAVCAGAVATSANARDQTLWVPDIRCAWI
jgi:hypothetical protein